MQKLLFLGIFQKLKLYFYAESFKDLNNNKQWDNKEQFSDVGNGKWDEGESFQDCNNNGKWDEGESFSDIGNGKWDEGESFEDRNGLWDKGTDKAEGAVLTSSAFGSVISWFPAILTIVVFLFSYRNLNKVYKHRKYLTLIFVFSGAEIEGDKNFISLLKNFFLFKEVVHTFTFVIFLLK